MTAMAASGLRARMESLDMLANNVANTSTGGYKADREFYSLYTASDIGDADAQVTMPVIESRWTDFSQGTLQPTGNSLDLALSGAGFFAVDGPAGPLYTRNGSFRVDSGGKLVTEDGYTVRGSAGAPLTIVPAHGVDIGRDGVVRQDGAVVGRLEIVDFTSGAGLSKQGKSYFRPEDTAVRRSTPLGVSVEQGQLEASNTGSAEAAVRLVSVMRQFEMLQRAASLASDMSRQAVQQVAKTGA